MSDFEKKLLSKFDDVDEIRHAWDLGLRQQVFENPLHKGMFNWIMDFYNTNAMSLAPTREIMKHEFPVFESDENVEEPTLWLVETLQRRYSTNQAQEIMREAAASSSEDPIGSLKDLWRKAYEATEAVAPRVSRSDMTNLEERRARYQLRMDRTVSGVTLGLPELDENTGGLYPGELCALAGFSKTGKSFYLAKVCVENLRNGVRPVIFSLELSKEEMEDRMDAIISGVSYDRLSKATLPLDELQVLHRAQEEALELGPLHVERPPEGERTVKNLVNRARQLGAGIIVIDQLSWMESVRRYDTDKGKHGEMISDLKKEITNDLVGKIPCLLAVQFNRQSQEGSGRGELHQFANASEIEQTVDLALGLSRTREERDNSSMRLDIMGSRRSDLQSYLLAWHLTTRTEISVRQIVERDLVS